MNTLTHSDWLQTRPGDVPLVLNAMDPNIIGDPYDWYRRLRVEAPLAFSDDIDAYIVTRYHDVRTVISDSHRFSNVVLSDSLVPNIFNSDDASHQRYRRAVLRHFNAPFMVSMEEEIRHHAADMAAEISKRTEVDLLKDFAYKLPIGIISQLLGVSDEDGADIATWADAIVEAVSSGLGYDSQQRAPALEQLAEMGLYFGALIEDRRHRPKDDLVSALVHHESDKLDPYELLLLIVTLMLTGHVTTVNMLGFGLFLGLERPDEWERARQSGWRAYVEETLRYEAPLQLTIRRTRQAVRMYGHEIPAETLIYACMGSANRDQDVFDRPDMFDQRRDRPGQHLSFGGGPHLCLAAVLARMEGAAAFDAMGEVLPCFELVEGGAEVRKRPGAHGLLRLVVRSNEQRREAKAATELSSWRSARIQITRPARAAVAYSKDSAHQRLSGADHQTGSNLAREMASLRGVLLKVGQFLSFVDVPGFDSYQGALETVRNNARAFPFADIKAILENELGAVDRLFAWIDPVPVAAASIGQVHEARTSDGCRVAIKTQYPDIHAIVMSDLRNRGFFSRFLWTIGRMLGFETTVDALEPVVDELRDRITEELDYKREAYQQERFRRIHRHDPAVRVPGVLGPLSTSRVITTEWVQGLTWSQARAADQALRDCWGAALFRAVFRSLYQYSLFNADPHPDNYVFQADGTVVLLDFGCVKEFRTHETMHLKELTYSTLNGDKAGARWSLECLGILKPDESDATDEIFKWLRVVYRPLMGDGVFTFTPEYAREVVSECAAMLRLASSRSDALTLPKDLVMLSRINMGLYSVLGALGSTGKWGEAFETLAMSGAGVLEESLRGGAGF